MGKTKNKIKPIDAPVYGYWKALVLSFYSKRLYIDVGKRWPGFGLGFLALLVLVWSVPLSTKMAIHFDEVFTQQIIKPLSLIPNVYIQNGNAVFDKPMPYFIKNKEHEVVLVIDTTGTISTFDPKYPYLSVLINKDKFAFKTPSVPIVGSTDQTITNHQPIVQYFKHDDNFILNGKTIVSQSFFSKWRIGAQFVVYPLAFGLFYGLFLLLFLAFGFLGQVFSRVFFSFTLPLKTSCRLLIVAATPMMFFLLILIGFNLSFTGSGFLLVSVLGLYFYYAIYCLKSESMRMVNV